MTMKLRVPVPFPANVEGAGGIGVRKANGVWIIEPGFDDLTAILPAALTDPSTRQLWIYDPAEDEYNVLTLTGLGEALYKLTSTTSLAIGTGSKTFVTQSGKDIGVGSFVIATSDADPADYMIGQVTAYSGTSLTVNVTATGGSGTNADWTIRASSPTGATGATGPIGSSSGIQWNFSATTADADPGSGIFRLNHATPASATEAYFDNNERGGTAVSAFLDTWDDTGNSSLRGYLLLQDPAIPATFYQFNVTGTVVDGTGYRKVTIAYVAGAGALPVAGPVSVVFIPRGATGAGDLASVNNLSDVANAATAFANIKQAATESATGVVELATTAEAEAGSDTSRAITAAGLKAAVTGEHTLNLLAAGLVSRVTNGGGIFSAGKATNDVMVRGYEFSAGTEQAIQISLPLPKGYNSTPGLVPKFYWTTSATAGTGNVIWGFRARYSRDDDAIDQTFGTAVEVTDGFLADGDTHRSAEASACTPGGTYAAECMLRVEIYRKAADASDTYNQTAILEAVMVSLPMAEMTDD